MYLSDKEFVEFMVQAKANIRRKGQKHGFIFVKENTEKEEEFDNEDAGIVRTDGKLKKLFEEAGLKLHSDEV